MKRLISFDIKPSIGTFFSKSGYMAGFCLSLQVVDGIQVPLLIAAGGGGKAYLEDPDALMDDLVLEQYENDTSVPGFNGQVGAAGKRLQHRPRVVNSAS